VGNSGLSGNPHLHLEFRIGPANFQFEEMAHYENNATNEEMENYCLWRVSGYFYTIDPMQIFEYYLQNR
jgi:murein DD-endopeptidase MepM/ murein hydrolase activator NlpD